LYLKFRFFGAFQSDRTNIFNALNLDRVIFGTRDIESKNESEKFYKYL